MLTTETSQSRIAAFIREVLPESEVVHVLGEIDISNATLFEEAIDRASFGSSLLIDLMHCTYLDSSALNVLLKRHEKLGAKLHVQASNHGIVQRIFDIMGIADVLQVEYRE